MAYNPRDYFYKKAKKEKFVARSVFKLEEIDQRFRIVKPGMKILDLGAAPGSWSQYCSKVIGLQGRVFGIDLQPIKLTLQNAFFTKADLRELNLDAAFEESQIFPPFDVVLSDMAPKTTGIHITDQARSLELCELALNIARRFLKPGGTFVAKLFHSSGFETYRDDLKKCFKQVEALRPDSTRKESKEIFLIGKNYTPPT